MFKVRNSMVPRSISNLFQRTDDDRCKIIFHLNQTLISRKNNLVTGVHAVAWNSLPCDLKISQTIQCFKNN
jgi:hypothetical protein